MSVAPIRAAPDSYVGPEWAVGMPAYWLRLLPAPTSADEADLLAHFYYPPTAPRPKEAANYDQRLLLRVGSERAVLAVRDFALRYFTSMGHKFTARSIKTVSERMVRGWELAGRPIP
jgi:hypothetical protein